jgi:hypothetical protein
MNIIKSWNGKLIRFRESDQYGCLTDMANATGKRVSHWLENKTTKEYLSVLSRSTGIPTHILLEVNDSTGTNEERGTWAHRRLCIRFAQWCSQEFAVQVDTWVEELLTKGSVSLPTDPLDLIIYQATEMKRVKAEQERLAEMQRAQNTRIENLINDLEVVQEEQEAINAEMERLTSPYGDYYSVLGYSNLKDRQIGVSVANSIGRLCSRICRERGIQKETVKDTRFGKVGAYPETILDEVFDDYFAA